MKRAIYFDERERDLARRVCEVVVHRFNNHLEEEVVRDWHQRMALRWTMDEVKTLAAKFEEPPPTDPIK